jgi:hypothetical protein
MAVVSEARAKDLINTNPQKYIEAFGTLIPDDYPKELWDRFNDKQKSVYIKWFFNKDDPSKLEEHGLSTLLKSSGAAGDIF